MAISRWRRRLRSFCVVSLSLLPIRRGGERDGEEVRGDSWRILRLNPVSGYIGSMMASPVPDSRRDYGLILEETELRLRPPGASCCADGEAAKGCGSGKRFFLETVDLKLNLSSEGSAKDDAEIAKAKIGLPGSSKPPAKSQVVGWPPLKSFRKNSMTNQKNGSDEGARFVKVSMDGAPYLRKVDLRMYKSYPELSDALANMFCGFIAGDRSESVVTCEDKDGDWMLVGDLPWEMFVDSCKCLRIMKGSEAIGLG